MSGAWYAGRVSWRRGGRALLFLAVIAGLIGGVLIAVVAGARRTDSAYDRLMRVTDGPHEVIFATSDAPRIDAFLRSARTVERFAPAAGMIGRRPPGQDWYSLDAPYDATHFIKPDIVRGRTTLRSE